MADVIESLSKQSEHMIVVQRVEYVAPFLARPDDAQCPQEAQLMGDGGLTHG